MAILLQDNYDNTFLKEIYTYPIVTFDELRRNLISKEGPVRIQYTTKEQYKRTTNMLGLMDDFKVGWFSSSPVAILSKRKTCKEIMLNFVCYLNLQSGVPRTAYHGIVSFFYNKRRVYLAPNVNWKGYDPSWS